MHGYSLRDIYYRDNANYEGEYALRFNAPYATHLKIDIKQTGRRSSFPAFFQYTEEIVTLLWNIAKASQSMQFFYAKLPALVKEQFFAQCIVEEIQATNAIEGVHSTRQEIREALTDIALGTKAKRFDSIIKKYRSVQQGEFTVLTSCQDVRQLYDYLVLEEVKNEDPNDVPDGDIFRRNSVSIFTGTNKEIHRGLYPEAEIIKAMNYALELINNRQRPRLIGIALFHYLFGYIHPFYNGNGRTARFIVTSYLAEEIDKFCSLRFSTAIKKRKNNYYTSFEQTNDEHMRGELTSYLTSFLEMVLFTIEDTISLLERKYTQLEKYKALLQAKLDAMGIADKTTRKLYTVLLEAVLFSYNGLTVEEVRKHVGVSRNTIDARLASMPKEHYIRDESGRAFRYRLNALILK